MIGSTDVLHPSSVPHLQTLKVFLIYFPKCSRFSTLQSYTPNLVDLFLL